MRKLSDGIWIHKNTSIFKDSGGYTVECSLLSLNVYKTLKDAVAAIDKYIDGTNKTEPRIIGTLFYNEKTKKLEIER